MIGLSDYDKFQELIVGKKLLMSAPIEKIEFKPVNSSKLRKESEKQYLRLWAHKGVQTIMFNANYQNRSPVYVEHDSKWMCGNIQRNVLTIQWNFFTKVR